MLDCLSLLQRLIVVFSSVQRAVPALKPLQVAGSQRPPFLSRQHSVTLLPGGASSESAMPILTAESDRKPVEDVVSPGTEPSRVGVDSDGGGVIVWEGEVTTRGCVLCKAELVSYGSSVKPVRM